MKHFIEIGTKSLIMSSVCYLGTTQIFLYVLYTLFDAIHGNEYVFIVISIGIVM